MPRKKEQQQVDKAYYDTFSTEMQDSSVTLGTAREIGNVAFGYFLESSRAYGGGYYRNRSLRTPTAKSVERADIIADKLLGESEEIIGHAAQLARYLTDLKDDKEIIEKPARVAAEWREMRVSMEDVLYLLYGKEIDLNRAQSRYIASTFIQNLIAEGVDGPEVRKDIEKFGFDPEGVEIVRGLFPE